MVSKMDVDKLLKLIAISLDSGSQLSTQTSIENLIRLCDGDLKDIGTGLIEGKTVYHKTFKASFTFEGDAAHYSLDVPKIYGVSFVWMDKDYFNQETKEVFTIHYSEKILRFYVQREHKTFEEVEAIINTHAFRHYSDACKIAEKMTNLLRENV